MLEAVPGMQCNSRAARSVEDKLRGEVLGKIKLEVDLLGLCSAGVRCAGGERAGRGQGAHPRQGPLQWAPPPRAAQSPCPCAAAAPAGPARRPPACPAPAPAPRPAQTRPQARTAAAQTLAWRDRGLVGVWGAGAGREGRSLHRARNSLRGRAGGRSAAVECAGLDRERGVAQAWHGSRLRAPSAVSQVCGARAADVRSRPCRETVVTRFLLLSSPNALRVSPPNPFCRDGVGPAPPSGRSAERVAVAAA